MQKFLLVFIIILSFTVVAFGQVTRIWDIQYTEDPSGDSPLLDSTVTIEGIISGESWAFGSTYYVQDSISAWSGIMVYDSNHKNAYGDSVRITATVTEYHGMTELGTVTSYELLGTGKSVAPILVSTGEIATAGLNAEAFEGVLVQVKDAEIVNPDLGYGEWSIDDGSGACRVDDAADYFFIPSKHDSVKVVTGLLNYANDDTKIEPRLAMDVLEGGEVTRLQYIQQVRYSDLIKAFTDTHSDTSYFRRDTFTVSGIVTVPTGLSYAGDLGVKLVLEESEGGPWSGILSYSPDASDYPDLFIGDSISLTGYIDEYVTSPSNMTEFWILETPKILGIDKKVPDPVSVETGDLKLPVTAEQWGNVMVVVNDAVVTDINPPSEPYGMFAVNDGTGEVWVDHDSDSMLTWFNDDNVLPVGTIYESIKGWVYHHYGSYADSSTYKLAPNYVEDMVVGSAPPQLTNVVRDPLIPLSSDAVEVSVNVMTNFTIASVTLNYSLNGSAYQEVGMVLSTGNTWTGEIPAQADGSRINYYIKAVDDQEGSTLAPSDTSLIQYSYVIADAGLTIEDIQYTTWPLADSPFEGCKVSVSGVVTTDTAVAGEFNAHVIQDGDGAWNGLFVFGIEEILSRGDEIQVWGTVTDYNADYHYKWDNNTMILADSFKVLSSGNIVNYEQLETGLLPSNNRDAEPYEGVQVSVSNVELISINSYDVTFDDGSGPCLVDDDMIAYDDFHVARYDGYLYAFGDTIWPGDIINDIKGVFTYSFGTYKISVRDQNDWGTLVGINADHKAVPYTYKLEQNFPNPFNPTTKIYFEIPQTEDVTIVVYNMLGQKVRTLVNGYFAAGQHVAFWDGRTESGYIVPSGVYIYRIKAGDFISSRKMVMLK